MAVTVSVNREQDDSESAGVAAILLLFENAPHNNLENVCMYNLLFQVMTTQPWLCTVQAEF